MTDRWTEIYDGSNVPLGRDERDIYQRIRTDVNSRVFAALDDETIDRIAERVADLLWARNRSGER